MFKTTNKALINLTHLRAVFADGRVLFGESQVVRIPVEDAMEVIRSFRPHRRDRPALPADTAGTVPESDRGTHQPVPARARK